MREKIVRAVAGTMILISVLLAFNVNIQWLWLAVFVGFNLLQSSFTKFCPLEKIFWISSAFLLIRVVVKKKNTVKQQILRILI